MAELNDKLITYGNLSAFYDGLQEQGLGRAIEDASVLPDASENKSKLIRLESDDNVYVSELKSRTSTTTNKLPDEQQIDKAYLFSDGDVLGYYNGVLKLVCTNGEIDGYYWGNEEGGYIFTTDNAVDSEGSTNIFYIDSEEWAIEDNIATASSYTTSDVLSKYSTIEHEDMFIISATYNAPESAQIGNANLDDKGEELNWIYDGTPVTLTIDGEQFTGYKWLSVDAPDDYILTDKQASNIYFYEDNGTTYCDVKCYRVSNGDAASENILYIYIPQLNAPDSEQVDNAYIYIDGESDEKLYYKGAVEGHFTDGNLTVYRWTNEDGDLIYFSKYPATQQYQDNSGVVSVFNGGQDVLIELYWDSEKDGWYSEIYTVSEAEENISQNYAEILHVNLYVVKYQRTVVTEEWDWQPLTDNATNDDIDLMFAAPVPPTPSVKRTLIRYQDAEQEAKGFIDWLVNTSGETMEFEGQTYYKWISWGNDISQAPVENDEIIVLTNTLDITLPFNMNSPEYEYTLFISDLYPGVGGVHGTFVKMEIEDANGNITYEE